MKLVSKLTLALVVGMCVVLAIYGYLSVRREHALFESDMQRDEHLIGRALGAAVTAVWNREGPERAFEIIRDASGREDGVRMRWIWLDAAPGDPHAPAAPASELEPLRSDRDVVHVDRSAQGAGRIYTYTPVRVLGERIGAIELSESLEEEDRYVRSSVINTVATTIALVCMSGLIAMGLGAWFVGRPVRALMGKARRIGEGDLKGPLVLGQHDELAELATEINLMCERLADARTSLGRETTARIATLEQLRHADRLTTVGKLASGIAHELGSPLNVVSGRAKMISRGASPDDVNDSARIIVEQVERMTRIIRQLLDFARRRGAHKAEGDLSEAARQTFSLLGPLAQKRGITLSLESEAPAGTQFDGGQIQQVLTNLVMNGIHAMTSGGRLTVAIRRGRARPPADHGGTEGEYLAVAVRDEGAGITADNLPHVFEPFFTTKDIGEGTGLGLSVAYGIVRDHGGWIEAESEVKKGSTFTMYLPGGSP